MSFVVVVDPEEAPEPAARGTMPFAERHRAAKLPESG